VRAIDWRIRLAAKAQDDYQEILQWTVDQFGVEQARAYADILTIALEDLCSGPEIVGVKERGEIGPNLYTLHVARKGRKGRHFVMFQVGPGAGENVIDVLRILHDSMDLQRHLPADDLH
jgi:toxin ParE1/3/4